MADNAIVLMQVPEIEGSSTLVGTDPGQDGSHEGWLPIESCAFALSRDAGAVDSLSEDEAEGAKPVHSIAPLVIKRRADSSTAPLLQWLANKEAPLKESVLIDYCTRSGRFYLRYELRDVEIVSSSIGFTAPDALTETITLTFGYITIVKRPIDIDGEVDVTGESTAEYEIPRPQGGGAA